jgi:hypothetical protein
VSVDNHQQAQPGTVGLETLSRPLCADKQEPLDIAKRGKVRGRQSQRRFFLGCAFLRDTALAAF